MGFIVVKIVVRILHRNENKKEGFVFFALICSGWLVKTKESLYGFVLFDQRDLMNRMAEEKGEEIIKIKISLFSLLCPVLFSL